LKIASFILKPSRGRVLVDSRDFWSHGEREKMVVRRMVGYVHDKPVLVRGSVRYNLELGLRLRGEGMMGAWWSTRPGRGYLMSSTSRLAPSALGRLRRWR
jgi:ABC-type multidrug transport system fused ATPase/permease subunit